ncbi:Calx-beta domain-containing protein, partial [Umezakia ovalisporum]|uniref:Calx-beta domain-containing protein n=2 Tax=Umezakia ovalisporum TaxID=75695 RepID=UPI0039C62659
INQADATYNFQAGNIRQNIPADYQGAPAKFDNQGTLTKTSTLEAGIHVKLDNSGTINLEAGTLSLTNDFQNTGTVTINAGSLAVTGNISNAHQIKIESGSASLTGGGTNQGTIYVDIDAALTLGGTFQFTTDGKITGRGSVTLNPGQLNFDVNQTSISDDLTVTFNGGKLNYQGNLAIEKYVLTANAGEFLVNANSTLTLGDGSWSTGTLVIDNKTSFDGNLSIGSGTKYITGTLQNQGVVTHNDTYVDWWGNRYYGDLYLNNHSQIINQADATYNFQAGNIRQNSTDGGATEGRFDNRGTLRKTGSLNSNIYVDLYNNGIIDTEEGNLYIYNDFLNTGSVNIKGGIAHFSSDFDQTAGEIVLHNGRLNSTAEINIQAGQIGGYGTINSNILSAGLLNPFVSGNLGAEYGKITILGNYTETDDAQIHIQIGGEDRGTEFDAIDISGTANFDGTIHISLLDDFIPVLGDSFTIINYADYTGDTELDFSGLIIAGGLRFNPVFNDNNLTLVVSSTTFPDAKDDAYGGYQNQILAITANQGLLANDSHPNNDILTAQRHTNAQFGNVNINLDGSFTYTPNPGFFGLDSFTYKTYDSNGDFDLATVTINVSVPPTDQPPIVANHIPAEIVNINANNSVIDLSNVFTDVDNDDNLITISVLSNSNPVLFDSVELSNRTLTLDYAADQFGTAEIVLNAESNGKTVSESFAVYVKSSNSDVIDDAPFVSNPLPDVYVLVNAPNQVIDLTNVFSDIDNDDNLIIKALLGNTNATLVNANIQGNTLTLDYHDSLLGNADITVLAISHGKMVQDTFRVTVANTAPVVDSPIPDQIINEGDTFSLKVGDYFSDPNGDVLNFAISRPGWLNFDANTQTLSGIPGNNHVGTTAITITATDGDSTVSDSFNLTVVDLPNGIFNLDNSAYTVNEGAGTLSVTVVRQGSSLGDVGVRLFTGNGTARSPEDYNSTVFDLNFANGETSKTVAIAINDDTIPEGGFSQEPETFNLTLSNAIRGALLGSLVNAVVNIVDNEPAIQKPIAQNDEKSVTALDIITIDVLGNDSDPDNYPQPIRLHRLYVDGQEYDPYLTPSITTSKGGIISIFNGGTPNEPTDDQLYYVAPDATITDTFTYTIKDGSSVTDLISEPATVTVNILAEPRNPTDNVNININGNLVNYTSNEIASFGNQDVNGNFTLYEGNTVDLDGNTWKAIALKDYGYTDGYIISTDTTLSFDFKSIAMGEIQGVAWARENLPTTKINPANVINVYGFNVQYGINDFDYTGAGNWQTFNINLSEYGSGIINYLLLVGDDDANNKGDTQIRNLQLNQTSTNQKPTDILLSHTSIQENQAVGTAIATISSVDVDTDDIHTYTLLQNPNSAFTINGNQLIANQSFDFETRSSYTIEIKSDDQRGGSHVKSFNIDITNDLDDDVSLAIAATNASQAEGNTDTKALTFTITRSGNTTSTNAVSWAVTGTETNPANPEDFGGTLPTGSVTFNPGDTSRLITVYVTGDTTVEADETFTVKLSNPTNSAIITTTTAIGTIQNDDAHTSVILDMKGGVDDYFISSYDPQQDLNGQFTISDDQTQ